MRGISSLILLIICVGLLNTCTKDYSYEGGPTKGTAIFSCISGSASGGYNINTALDPTNIITLQVDVSKAGTYIITTASINGMQFTNSGNFADTGVYTIILKGAGKPVNSGNVSFAILNGSGCTIIIPVTSAPVILANYTLAGEPDHCSNAALSGSYISHIALTAGNNVELTVDVKSVGLYTISTDTIAGIYFSASGNFSATGIQKISLKGFGTPELPGNFMFTPRNPDTHCSFTVTITNQDPLATYVLESGSGNPSPCIYTVSGNYKVGVPLTNSNTVTMHVFVTQPGNFTIQTNTVNGMLFSYTGVFTTTGAQLVQLNGSGMPASAGTLTFLPGIVGPHPLGGETCAFTITII